VSHLSKIALVLLCGCGRFGFESSRAQGDATGSDGVVDDGATDGLPDGQTAICHTGTWGTPVLIASTATISEEADPSISPDELSLFFESNRTPPSTARAIWMATRATKADAFGAPTRVVELDDAMDDYDPSLSSDGLQIWFGSLRSGTRQIYTATRADTTSPFSAPTLVTITGDAIAVRSSPRVTPDGLGLYYARDLEVAFASRSSTTVDFAFVRELDEVNAPPTDGSPTITDDGLELFFDSYRNGPAAIFTASRSDTSAMFSGLTQLTELPMVTNGIAAGSPDISADGRTLYYWINVNPQLELYTVTRSCP
jgi:Tol biopolymer transport system component